MNYRITVKDYSLEDIYFERAGSGTKVLLLHGWGASTASFKPVFDRLSQNYDVISLDFPGFGKSKTPPSDWGVKQYADLVANFIISKEFYPCNLIGHSFGGRIAILLSSKYKDLVSRVVLVDSAGLKPRRKPDYYLKVFTYKTLKRFFFFFHKDKNDIQNNENFKRIVSILKLGGSADYQSSGALKSIFVRVVNEDLTKYLSSIDCPVLLIYGENDKETPLYMAKKMKRRIKDSGLVVLKDAAHYSYLDQFGRFIAIVDYFFMH